MGWLRAAHPYGRRPTYMWKHPILPGLPDPNVSINGTHKDRREPTVSGHAGENDESNIEDTATAKDLEGRESDDGCRPCPG